MKLTTILLIAAVVIAVQVAENKIGFFGKIAKGLGA